ncbi:DUF4064 domain-containing protein [Terribacillus saccharophilus]|uniref:DUF4064 domain-containing protein n=1 Tax=Terribacillus saccharophilus TaxID=361277 RepID=UPI00398221BD
MIKRTAELVLGIIGVVFNILMAIGVGGFFHAINALIMANRYNDPEFTAQEADFITNLFGGFGWYYIIISAIAGIMGIVALILLRRNSQSTASGIIFISTALLLAILTFFFSIIPAILYASAGIIAIMRKPIDTKQDIVDSY